MIEKITQSFIKDYREYQAGELCGNLIKAKYIDGRLLDDPTDSMEEGIFFEYCLSGALPKSKKVPQPVFMDSAIKRNKGKTEGLTEDDWYVEYRRAKFNADFVKGLFEKMGLVILEAGIRLTNGRFQGDIDLICKCTKNINVYYGLYWHEGDEIILDLKYSGLLYDKFSKHGWQWSEIQKTYHGTQAKQYNLVGKRLFHFFVVDNKNKQTEDKKSFEIPNIGFFCCPINSQMVEDHIIEANALFDNFRVNATVGFMAYPSWRKCQGCILKGECPDKHEFPHPEIVHL